MIYVRKYYEIWLNNKRFVSEKFNSEEDALDYINSIEYDSTKDNNYVYMPFEIKRFFERRWVR